MPFTHTRTVHFQDTDAAGVVYFANVLNFCHEAYEASLAATGIALDAFFRAETIAVPIVHAEVELRQPLVCGQVLTVHVQPQPLGLDSFQIRYEVYTDNPKPAAIARTRHVCIQPQQRQRQSLPQNLLEWMTHWQLPQPVDN